MTAQSKLPELPEPRWYVGGGETARPGAWDRSQVLAIQRAAWDAAIEESKEKLGRLREALKMLRPSVRRMDWLRYPRDANEPRVMLGDEVLSGSKLDDEIDSRIWP